MAPRVPTITAFWAFTSFNSKTPSPFAREAANAAGARMRTQSMASGSRIGIWSKCFRANYALNERKVRTFLSSCGARRHALRSRDPAGVRRTLGGAAHGQAERAHVCAPCGVLPRGRRDRLRRVLVARGAGAHGRTCRHGGADRDPLRRVRV